MRTAGGPVWEELLMEFTSSHTGGSVAEAGLTPVCRLKRQASHPLIPDVCTLGSLPRGLGLQRNSCLL